MTRIFIIILVFTVSFPIYGELFEQKEIDYEGETLFVPSPMGLCMIFNHYSDISSIDFRGSFFMTSFLYEVDLGFNYNLSENRDGTHFILEIGSYRYFEKERDISWSDSISGAALKPGIGYTWSFDVETFAPNKFLFCLELQLPIPFGGFKELVSPVDGPGRYPKPMGGIYVGFRY